MTDTIRLFIAIELSKETQEKLSAVIKELKTSGADVKWVKPENIHLTLKFLGYAEATKVNEIAKIIEITAREFSKFSFEINELGAFPKISSARVIWVNAQEPGGIINKIVLSLEEKLEKLGFSKEEREFSPHITIGRVRTSSGRLQLMDKLKATKILPAIIQPADKITLFQSTLTPSGPVYEAISQAVLR